MTEDLKQTPLDAVHRALGARMVPFAGYSMPVQYTGIIEEHRNVRENAGLFDVSHMGEVTVKGRDALAFLQWITTNDVAKLEPGKSQYSLLCTPKGTIVDDIIVSCLQKDHFFICVNASNRAKDFEWLKTHAERRGFQVSIADESDRYAQLAIQGPKAIKILQTLTGVDLPAIKPFHFVFGKVADVETMISRTGYTGEDGFELYFDAPHAPLVWNKLMEAGKEHGLRATGLGARDTLRLEVKYCLYGNDIDDEHTALEAGLGWVVKFEKGDFLGRGLLAQQKEFGVARHLVGFKMVDKAIPRHGFKVMLKNQVVGEVTSGTHSPSLDADIGCAYVPTSHAKTGSIIEIDVRGKLLSAEVVKTPFYQRKP